MIADVDRGVGAFDRGIAASAGVFARGARDDAAREEAAARSSAALFQIAELEERASALRKRLGAALAYPAVVTAAAATGLDRILGREHDARIRDDVPTDARRLAADAPARSSRLERSAATPSAWTTRAPRLSRARRRRGGCASFQRGDARAVVLARGAGGARDAQFVGAIRSKSEVARFCERWERCCGAAST